VEENDYTIEYTLTGFSYNESDNSLYYILSTRKRTKTMLSQVKNLKCANWI